MRRIHVHLPPDEHGTTTRRGVASAIECPECGETFYARSHYAVLVKLTEHRLGRHF